MIHKKANIIIQKLMILLLVLILMTKAKKKKRECNCVNAILISNF